MNIGIEARKLFSVDKHGMDLVALELIKHIPELCPDYNFTVFTQSGSSRVSIPKYPNLKIVELPHAPVPGWEQFILPMAVKKHKCDLLHCTSNTGPIRLSVPVVLTLHDIIFLENIRAIKDASNIYLKLKNHYRRFVVPKLVNFASKVITVSKYQEKVIRTHLSLTNKKITTIYNGVSQHFTQSCNAEKAQSLKKQFNLPDSFLLFLASEDPKKNTKGMIVAYGQYYEKTEAPIPLVVADITRKKLNRLLSEVGLLYLKDEIIPIGYVANDEMPYVYSLATLFLYPSLKESFGIPILEAMSCGTPVITSNTSSMPEVAENAAYIIDPFDTLSIAKAIHSILDHEILRERLIKSGFKQIEKYSFKKMSGEVLSVYNEVLGVKS